MGRMHIHPKSIIPALASFKGQGVALPGFWRREGPAFGRWLNPVSGPSDSRADVSKHPSPCQVAAGVG